MHRMLWMRYTIVPSQLILRDAQWSSMEGRGGGAFADIYRAKYRGKTVAVKRLRVFQMTDDVAKNDLINSLYHESLLWRHLSHPHILPFLGIADDIFNESLCMIMPWSEHGNVRDVIHNWKENVNSSIQDLFISVHTWLNEIASGLAYLHGEDINIAHGDLRGVNILIDSEYKIRLADFGLAVFAGDSSNHYASVRGGASHWLAPEIIDPEAFGMSSSRPTFAADIYSFACVCIELYTSQAPFSGWNSTTVLLHVLRGGRPARPAFHQTEEMSEQLYALLQRCWDQSWDKRPTAEELSQMLSGMMPLLLGQQGSSLDTENPRPGPDVNLHPRRVRSLNVGDKPIKNTSADVKSEVIDVAELQESPKLVPLPDVTGALKAIGAGVRAFTRDITWIMNGLDEVAKIHPVISVATIAFRIVIDLEMTRRENDTRIQYIYTEMKDMMIVLLQLKDVMELNDLGPDGNTLASKLEPLCRQVAEDVKACANTCDAFLKQYLLPKVLKMEEWYDQLVSYVLIFARKRSELQLAVAIHTARTGDEVASALTSSFISQRIELFSQLLRQHTPSQESLLREAVSFRGGVQAVMNNETDARELLKMQEAIRSDLNRGDLESHVPMTYTDFKEILAQTCNNIVTQNMTVFGVKYDLLLRKLNETPSLPEAERIPSLITGPYDRIKDYVRHYVSSYGGIAWTYLNGSNLQNIRSLWKEMGWRMSVKSSHFIHALHDLFQEQKYDEGLLEPASEGWTLDYLEDRWHRSIVEAIDDDRTGFVTIAKLNRFTDACFPGWSLVRWLSYWAIEEMTSGLQDLEVHSKDLATEFQPYISHEEDRMKVNLTIIKYSIDALDTVYAVTGPGNLENHIMTLLYLLLDRDLQLFKAAQIQILHPRELQDAATNILRVNNVVNNRVKDLTVLFNQRDLDLDYHFEVCAYGLFKYIHDYEPLWVFDKRMEVDDFQPLLVLPNYLDERESTAPEALVDVALLRYPTTQERTAFAYLALDASAEDTHRDESLPFHVIRGLWYGFSYTTTMYPTNWMVAYDLDFLSESSDGRAISSTGTHVEHGDYMLTGILSEAPDGAVILKLQVTYESDARTEYLTGQLQPDGSILCSLSWGEDEFYAVPVQCEVILRRVSSDVMRLRPSPWELSQDSTRARALWRFALQSTLHEVRKKNWSWHYFAERRRRRKRTVDLMMAASSVSLVNRPTDEELAACRQSVNTSDALLYKSLADYFKLVGPNHR
ncbi:hypothetical protein EUX98_g6507 [Antrodiella citrinella]|uniref:Protein kinase domain-containing protein n=1 Tax=Antrodiella citrinella TaxID=2447956 RepID=A0A4S4MNT9_9APHY|nr:hypothetical protein EUX98_g6507 [Antrodiella citrinella]